MLAVVGQQHPVLGADPRRGHRAGRPAGARALPDRVRPGHRPHLLVGGQVDHPGAGGDRRAARAWSTSTSRWAIPRWATGDPRAAITWRQWINMVDGQAFREIGRLRPHRERLGPHAVRRGPPRRGRLRRRPAAHPPARQALELQLRRGEPDRRRPGPPVRPGRHGPAERRARMAQVMSPRAVRAAGDDLGQPAVRRHRHLHGQRPVLRHGPRLRPLRPAVPARRGLGGPPAAARGLGRLRPHQHAAPRTAPATAPAGGSSPRPAPASARFRPRQPERRARPVLPPRATRVS